MNRVKIFAAVALIAGIATVGTAVNAQQKASAAASASALEILKLKGAQGFYQGASTSIVQNVKNMLLQSNLNYGKDLNELAPIIAQKFAAREQEVGNEFVRQYATAFSEQELKDLVAFYSSPLGKKMTELEPKLVQGGMQFMKEWGDKLSSEIIDAFRTEMKKRGKDM